MVGRLVDSIITSGARGARATRTARWPDSPTTRPPTSRKNRSLAEAKICVIFLVNKNVLRSVQRKIHSVGNRRLLNIDFLIRAIHGLSRFIFFDCSYFHGSLASNRKHHFDNIKN